MKSFKVNGRIIGASYKSSSYYGNPKYRVSFEDNEGNYYRGETANNAACAYGINDSKYTRNATITFHYTRNNNLIIDYIS